MDVSKQKFTNSSINASYQESITFMESRRPRLERCLLCLVTIFFITTAVFGWLYLYTSLSLSDEVRRDVSEKSQTEPCTRNCTCTTPDCVETAAVLLKKMDLTVSPCDDFYQFACGRFIREERIPEGRSSVGTVILLHEENQRLIKGIIEEEPKADDPLYMNQLKDLYASCRDEDAIERTGVRPYLDSEFPAEWPTLNKSWDPSTFDLNEVLVRFAKEFVHPIVHYSIANDFMNSTSEVIYVSEPSLLLPMEYYAKARNDTAIMAVERYYRDVAVELGADPAVAANDARDVIDYEIAVSKVMVPKEEMRDRQKLYRPTTLEKIGQTYTFVDIRGIIEVGFSRANITLPGSQKVIDPTPTFFRRVGTVINATNPRVMQNAFSFNYARRTVSDLTRKMRDIRFELDKVVNGKKDRSPRSKSCAEWTAGVFGEGLAKEFVKRKFSENSKKYVGEMIDDLQEEFLGMLTDATWMSLATKERALYKLSLMDRRIGYPDKKFSEEHITSQFENWTISRDLFYENMVEIRLRRKVKKLKKITKPADRDEWPMYAHQVNAFYDFTMNGITFLAGIMQPPFFSYKFPRSVNYGAIGSVIGHEITHGFDDTGSQYNFNGNLGKWWEPADLERFVKRRQCVVDQYSGFKVDEIGMNINGIHTQGENIADTGGIKEAYRAYLASTKRYGKEKRLPGLNLSPEQIFFLSNAQVYCERSNKQKLIDIVSLNSHPPGKFRVLGSLQNSDDFSRVYKCPVDSPMNPTVKCTVW